MLNRDIFISVRVEIPVNKRVRYTSAFATEVCPTNSTDKQSLQFTINRVLFKIFGAMAKDSYLEISSHFGIYPLEQSIALRGDKIFEEKKQFVGQLFMSADSQTLV